MSAEKKKETFASPALALGVRDIVTKMVEQELKKQRPEYSYASVVRINRRFGTCRVAFPGDLGEADVRLGGTVPAHVGLVVRIDGLRNDRYIVDVIGPAADVWPGVMLAYPFGELPHAGYLWADGTAYDIANYPDLAWYRGYKDTYYDQILAIPNLSAYYRLDETSGTTCADSSGNGANCTYTGSPTLGSDGAITGDSNTSVTFATGKYASRASGSSPWGAATVQNRHMSGWVNLTSASMRGCFFCTNGVGIGVGNVDFTANGNRLIVVYNGVRWINTGLNIGTGWHHVGVSIAGPSAAVHIFLDGVLVYSDALGHPASANQVTAIGNWQDLSSYPFAGRIDEVVFANRFVYEDEVRRVRYRGMNKFFVTDMRGCVPIGMDSMGGGAAAGRITSVVPLLDNLVGVEAAIHDHELSDFGWAQITSVIGAGNSQDMRGRRINVPGYTYTYDGDDMNTIGSTGTATTATPLDGSTDGRTVSRLQPSRFTNWIVKT